MSAHNPGCFGAAGLTAALIARHARERGHRPLLAGRTRQPSPRWPPAWTAAPDSGPGRSGGAAAAKGGGRHLFLNAAGPFCTPRPRSPRPACVRNALSRHRQPTCSTPTARPPGRRRDHPGRRVRRRGHQLPGPPGQRGGRRRAAAGRGGPGRHRPARPRRRRLHPGNLPYGGWIRRGHLHPQPLGSGVTTIPLPDGLCHVMPFPPATWKQRSRPPALRTSPRSPPSRPAPEPQTRRPRDAWPTYRSDGPGPPARTEPPPRRGCKPLSRTPSPPPPASAP